MEKKVRCRANVSQSVKGIQSPDGTFEITYTDEEGRIITNDAVVDETIEATKILITKLRELYPPQPS